MRNIKIQITIAALFLIQFFGLNSFVVGQEVPQQDLDSGKVAPTYTPSFLPTYTPNDRYGDPFSNTQSPSPLLLEDPSNLELELEIDTGMNYTIYERVGALNYRPRSTMTFEEFQKYQDAKMKKEYWQNRSAGVDGESAVSGRRLVPKIYISPMFDRIFGGSYVDLEPTGFVNMDFGGRWTNVKNPSVPVSQQRNGGFNYDQQISMSLIGKVGEKLAVTANFDNNSSFNFQNNMKVEYTGFEEDIIKKIEVGNVSMPVANSLMTGGQSLFGVKTQLQFGKLYVTALASRQQGSSKTKSFTNGSEGTPFDLRASDYDQYRHFFLGHFFRDNYENSLRSIPQKNTSVQIIRLEVYVVKSQNETTGLRGVVAFADLGEPTRIRHNGIPSNNSTNGANDNDANDLYDVIKSNNESELRNISTVSDYLGGLFVENQEGELEERGLQEGIDYEARPSVRKLDDNEYKWDNQLGYVTLRNRLREGEVLAVSYEYTYDGQRYQVGEMSDAYQGFQDDELVILKLLLPADNTDMDAPIWDLGMKNIYSLGGSRISSEEFELKVNYRDDINNYDAPYLNEGQNTTSVPLVELLKIDQLNVNGDNQPDANFDFIEGITFDSDYGNVIFPVLEPFGSNLEDQFGDTEQTLKDKYVYNELYTMTKTLAEQVSAKNKFRLTGSYSSGASGVYSLDGFNISEGSVKVTAGGTPLVENQHYTVNYQGAGQVTITDQGILSSGKTINITYEVDDLFNFQTKWLTGTRLDYQFNDRINLGATLLHLKERTGGISRYAIGNEPINNTKYGFDLNYQEDSRVITKVLDALPLLSTKEPSTVTFSGEFAQLVPGTSAEVSGESASYIDDFENATTNYPLGGGSDAWMLGSTPSGFSVVDHPLGAGFRRAKLAWYVIDNSVYTSGNNALGGLNSDNLGLENSFVRGIARNEIFQGVELSNLDYSPMSIFDLAYYPRERGPYNYNDIEGAGGLNSDGLFGANEAKSNFASITRGVPTNIDFTTNNVEYIEFWLMDPFDGDPIQDGTSPALVPNGLEGGKLVIHLGEVSEDILDDNVQSFENGLPKDGGLDNTQETDWGKVSTQTFLTPYFEDTDSRDNQDVGLDGLDDDDERNFTNYSSFVDFVESNVAGTALQNIEADISADNFKHYLDPEFGESAPLLERYKNYNGYEGNSDVPTTTTTTSATNIPESEDANDDRDMNTTESYFEYDVPITSSGLVVGEGYVVDRIQDFNEVDWFLMRIPIKRPTSSSGTPSLQYLRFIRMHMTDWSNSVVLRMANFQMVGSQWRTFEDNLAESEFGELPETAASDVEISVVNIEQNGSAVDGKIPYTLPPGISRDIDNSTATQTAINEQSLKICVEDLEDGDARAAFKTGLSLDMINYGKIKMFFHGESNNGQAINDDEVNVFIRFGLDQVSNYYEIELPLKITPDGQGPYSQDEIWPDGNILDLALNELYTLKSARNGDDFDVNRRYSRQSSNDQYILTVVGNPKLSGITDMMIGVRNPSTDEDRSARSVCIWANELRVTDFDSQKGWSANAQMNLKLADFANVSASANHTTVGFGGIQETISQRTRSETTSYDVSATVNVDKLIPVETGIKLPMFVSTSKSTDTPQYDPLDDDIPLEASLAKFDTEEEKEDYREKVISQVTEKSINFVNVRKEKVNPESKTHIYDIENFAFSYSYSERKSSNINTALEKQKRYSGSVNYNYAVTGISIEPFKNVSMSSPYLKLIKDLNFSPLPNNISVRGSMDRSFQKTQLRNADLTIDGVDPNFEKYFTFNRSYNVRWNLFKGLNLSYTANVKAIIDEAEGDVNTQAEKDSIWTNIKNFGRTKDFDQNLSLNYRLPLDKLPITDWVSADYRYQVQYTWTGGNIDQVEEFGNIASNSRNRDVNAKFDFVKLYNKSKYLSKINKPPSRSRSSRYDTTRTSAGGSMFKGVLRMVMSVRSLSATYGLKETTTLPGLKPSPYSLGMDKNFESPGWQFLAGSQDPDIRYLASDEGWLVLNSEFSNNFIQSRTEDINLRASIEPFKDFKIQVDAKRSNTAGYSELYKFNDNLQRHESQTPSRTGSYSVTFLPIQTAFNKTNDNTFSEVFEEFVANRSAIQRRQDERYTTNQEYNINSQDVLLPAFIAAYRGISPNNVSLDPLPKIPFPNWRLDYGGLGKLSGLKEIFSSVNITHAYSSSFSVSNYTSSGLYNNTEILDLTNDILDYPLATEDGEDGLLVPVYIISNVDVLERFSPLLGISVRTKSMMSGKLEYSRERSLSFDLYNNQITELKSDNMSFDIGVTKDKMKVPFKLKGRSVVLDNQIEFRLTFTVRDTKTIQRKIEDVNTTTEGILSYQYRPTISYVVNEKLNITMYYDRSVNEPKVSSSFETINSSFGVQIRFNLAQ